MKRILLCLVLISILLSGCRKQTAPAALTDPRGSLPFDQRCYNEGSFLETSFADYYSMSSWAPPLAFIQVQPKGSCGFVPLCSKPNCTHSNESCNAACVSGGGLGYCNNRLFTVANSITDPAGFSVISMLPDGTDRRTETEIPNPVHSDGTQGGSYQFAFHENLLLALYTPSTNLPLEEQVERLYVVDLTSGSVAEPFVAFFSPGVSLGGALRPVGSTIYVEAYFRNADGTLENWWLALRLDTGEVKKLFPFDYPYEFYVEDDVFYYLLPQGSFMEYDLRTGQTTNRGTPMPEFATGLKLDGDLIYMLSNAAPGNPESWDLTMYFLNRDYEVLDQLHLDSGIVPLYADADRCYFTQAGASRLIGRLEKAEIGTGNLKLLPLE